jgi:hypothetical protein
MDVLKESIDITLAEQSGEVRRMGQIGGDRRSLLKMVRKQRSRGRELEAIHVPDIGDEAIPATWCAVATMK